MTQSSHNQQGISLLLSLIIMAGITAIGIVMSILIINELKQTQFVDYSIIAYHAAESGIERSLFEIKADRGSSTLGATLSAIQRWTSTNPITQLSNRATWDTSASTNESDSVKVPFLAQDHAITIDLFNPDDALTDPGIESVNLTWDNISGVSPYGVEVTWTGLNTNANEWCNFTVKKVFEMADNIGAPVDLTQGQPAEIPCTPNYYRVSVKPLYRDIKNLEVTAYNSTVPAQGSVVKILSRVIVKSTGVFAGSQKQLIVEVPWLLPASGLYDYVLFGGNTITK